MKIEIFILVTIFITIPTVGVAYAESPIMITFSKDIGGVIFDGKWSFYSEWKESSLNTLAYDDGTVIQLRTAHDTKSIYILVDELSFSHFDKRDRAIVCFDAKNDRGLTPDSNDYCFGVPFGGRNGFALRGGSPLASMEHFSKIPNPEGFIAISSISDKNDRYTQVPHPSYEFKIPTSLIGKSDNYGFYFGLYKGYTGNVLTWPKNITASEIPSPNTWGNMISPDHSIPEFQSAALIFTLGVVSILFFHKRIVLIKK